MLRRALLTTVGLLALCGLVGLDATPATAADTFHTVTTVSDVIDAGDGVVSLREAVTAAGSDVSDSTVVLAAGQTYVLDLCGAAETANASGDLNPQGGDGVMTISGNGAAIQQTCDDQGVISSLGELYLDHVTITGGDLDITQATSGGGVQSHLLVVTDSTITGNSAQSGGGLESNFLVVTRSLISANTSAVGGGISTTGPSPQVAITDSSIVGNTANSAPGVHFTQPGTATLTNTTIGGSTAAGVNLSVGTELNVLGDATLVHSTIVGTANGSAVRVGGSLNSFGSVIDRGTGASSCASLGNPASQGHNVDSDDSCGFDAGTDRPSAADTGLGPLADNGGAGESYLPDDGGLLDGMIPPVDCHPIATVDVRGQARPTGAGCEPGAVELPVSRRPDAHVRNAGQPAFGGNDVYSTTGAGQTRTQNRGLNQRATFFARFQNDGDETDGLRVRGPAGSAGFAVRYFVGSTNVTNAVTHAGHVFTDVAPGATRVVRVEVTPGPNSRRNVVKTLTIRGSSTAETTVQDVVRAAVKRV